MSSIAVKDTVQQRPGNSQIFTQHLVLAENSFNKAFRLHSRTAIGVPRSSSELWG